MTNSALFVAIHCLKKLNNNAHVLCVISMLAIIYKKFTERFDN